MKNVFLIGPASVGKSTTGQLLARKLDYNFIDIDLEFCNRIELIPDYINRYSYVAYCEANSALVDKLIKENRSQTVFATPSGFLAHEESPQLVKKHLEVIADNAISVLLLPSENPEDSAGLIVKRQLDRYPELSRTLEQKRYIRRHKLYRPHGNIQIIGNFSPDNIVRKIIENIKA